MRLAKLSDGFTLIEVLLVVAIISLITVVSAPLLLSFQDSNELNVATSTVEQYLYEAQSYSRNGAHDCGWGVIIVNQNLILFCGDSYGSRQPAYDTIYEIPSSVFIKKSREIDYSKITGLPQSAGSFIFLARNKQSVIVTVNNKGMLKY